MHVVDAKSLFYGYFLYFFIYTTGVNSFVLLCCFVVVFYNFSRTLMCYFMA